MLLVDMEESKLIERNQKAIDTRSICTNKNESHILFEKAINDENDPESII